MILLFGVAPHAAMHKSKLWANYAHVCASKLKRQNQDKDNKLLNTKLLVHVLAVCKRVSYIQEAYANVNFSVEISHTWNPY